MGESKIWHEKCQKKLTKLGSFLLFGLLILCFTYRTWNLQVLDFQNLYHDFWSTWAGHDGDGCSLISLTTIPALYDTSSRIYRCLKIEGSNEPTLRNASESSKNILFGMDLGRMGILSLLSFDIIRRVLRVSGRAHPCIGSQNELNSVSHGTICDILGEM